MESRLAFDTTMPDAASTSELSVTSDLHLSVVEFLRSSSSARRHFTSDRIRSRSLASSSFKSPCSGDLIFLFLIDSHEISLA